MSTDGSRAGTTVGGRYRLERELGRGAMGVVYRAHDMTLERDVAVKLVAPMPLGTDGKARLLREARAAARLNHPHIVSVHDAGEESDTPYIVMELIEGRSLRDAGALSRADVLEVAAQICEALEHAHAREIVHRDVKPENILLVESGGHLTAKLTDFGVARIARGADISVEGAIVGTALYMAPEQAIGEAADGRADLYSLGAVLYELLTGRPPFTGTDAIVVIAEHLHAPVVPPRTHRPDISPALEALVLKLLAKRPEDRMDGARQVADRLRELKEGEESGASVSELPDDKAATVALLAQLARGRLVGRRGELSNLRELWNGALKGTGRLALISGEPGVGKTRLAGEILVHAQLSGALLLRGGSYEFEAATPYLPFVEALRGWVSRKTPEDLRRDLGPTAVELARLAPEIETLIGPLPPNPQLGPNEERLRLFDNVARFLKSRAAERGVLLFLDDLHWADQGSLSLLHYLLRQLKQDRILILGAYREAELDRTHPLSAALVEWNREGLAMRIALGRLSAEETGNLLATLFGQTSVSDDFAGAMYRETEGNPFFIEEVVKSLIEQGQIYRKDGAWQRSDVSELTIPQSVKEAIGRRLNRLDESCLDVLHAAAALGKGFQFEELAATLGTAEDGILDALDKACAVQLLRADRNDRFIFTHDKVREVLYSELNPIRRRRLHLKIGQNLESLYSRSLDTHVQDLAYHFTQSGNLEKGYEYSLRAAGMAEKVFAIETALRYYESARDCAESMNSPEHLVTVHEKTGLIHEHSGNNIQAAQFFQKALDASSDSRKRAELKILVGGAWCQIADERGLSFLTEALAELDPETQAASLAQAICSMGRFHHYRMEISLAVERLEEARRLAEPLGDPHLLTRIYAFLAGAYQHKAQWPESIAWAERCIELGIRNNLPAAEAIGHEFMAEGYPHMGQWRESLVHADRNREIGRSIGAMDRMAWADFAAMFAHGFAGNLREAVSYRDACLALAREIGETRLALFCATFSSSHLVDLGRDDVLGDIEEVMGLSDHMAQRFLKVHAFRSRGYFHFHRGELSEALSDYEKCDELLRPTDHNLSRILVYPELAEVLVALGRLDQAQEIHDVLLGIVRLSNSPLFISTCAMIQGLILQGRGRLPEALDRLNEAATMAREMETKLLLGRILADRSRVHRAAGNAADAGADASEARSLFERIGAVRDVKALDAGA